MSASEIDVLRYLEQRRPWANPAKMFCNGFDYELVQEMHRNGYICDRIFTVKHRSWQVVGITAKGLKLLHHLQQQLKPTLANGGKLTKDTWADFVKRLHHDTVGAGVADHCTKDAIFIVQARERIAGFDPEYAEHRMVCVDDASWTSIGAYLDDCYEEERKNLNKIAAETYGVAFLDLDVDYQWDILNGLDDHSVTYYHDGWRDLGHHLTKDSAEAFIKRKGHDYPMGLRVYVDSTYYNWELNTIREAILSGHLQFVPPDPLKIFFDGIMEEVVRQVKK